MPDKETLEKFLEFNSEVFFDSEIGEFIWRKDYGSKYNNSGKKRRISVKNS